MSRLPGNVFDWLATICKVFKKLLVELVIIFIFQLFHQVFVACISLEHWLQDGLRLEQGLDLVLQLLLLDIILDLLIREQKFPYLKLMSVTEALAQRIVVDHVSIDKHFDGVGDSNIVSLILVFLNNVVSAWDVFWKLEREWDHILASL